MAKRIMVKVKEYDVDIFEISDNYLFRCNENKEIVDENMKAYLARAEYVNVFLDKGNCIFSGEEISSPDTWKSDGLWIWSSDLEYYSELYNFVWIEDFIKSVRMKNYEMQKVNEERLFFLERVCIGLRSKFEVESHSGTILNLSVNYFLLQ